METRYKECVENCRGKLKQYECHAYFPTAWKNVDGEWKRLEGF